MRDVLVCFVLIFALLSFFMIFGYLTTALFGIKIKKKGQLLLLGTFVYFIVFQAAALPLILCKKPLSWLSTLWLAVLALTLCAGILCIRQQKKAGKVEQGGGLRGMRQAVCSAAVLVMFTAMALQFYLVITSERLVWDTSFYVGTIATSVEHNSMYLFQSETGRREVSLHLRYALSGFYMHGAVWSQVLKLPAIYVFKIVQGGTLSLLSGMTVYQLGSFLFSGNSYQTILPGRKKTDAAAWMTAAFALFNLFFSSAYASAEFLLFRGAEAKAYCANFVLPCIFLFCLMLWRDEKSREGKLCLFTAMLGSVPISMSSLVLAPAMMTILLLPLLLWGKDRKALLRYGMLCVLPNVCYLIVYALYNMGKIRIGV